MDALARLAYANRISINFPFTSGQIQTEHTFTEQPATEACTSDYSE